MYLKYLQIINYKNLKTAKFEFSKGTNSVIGENDSGKSNAMTAIRILLDNGYFYNSKRLKENDFSDSLDDWRGHWIIISAYFDEISANDKHNEICNELIPNEENYDFLKSYIRCKGYNFGTVTLFIRPSKTVRKQLANASGNEEFVKIRSEIKLTDYEFCFTSRMQVDFTNEETYRLIVGDIDNNKYADPDEDDANLLGEKINIVDVWQHISIEFIDALRDVESEMHKPKNPLRRMFDVIQSDILSSDKENIKSKITELNNTISSIKEISNIGNKVNGKLNEIVGLVYSPEILVESRIKEDVESLAKYLSLSPNKHKDIDLLGLGHLNILYIALKLVEFEYNRNNEIINIMIIEEPEAHIHTHIQKALFDNLNVSSEYTQIIMTTHSTHLSEVSDIRRVNVMMNSLLYSKVMKPTSQLDEFGYQKLKLKDISLTNCLKRYLDAKRSVLLFSKGVILVEGDGEEILIPAMVKKAFGISLDEIGIGLINIGSIAFEYVASIFDEERLQRHCAIITDLDSIIPNSEKCSEEAAKRGLSRKEKLEELYGTNPWVESFYAPYTFEVDFANEQSNRTYICEVIKNHYVKQETINRHISNLSESESKRYDTVLTVAESMKKGWYATILASIIDNEVVIPEYILRSIVYASQEVITPQILKKISLNVLDMYEEDKKICELKEEVKGLSTAEEINTFVLKFCQELPEDLFSSFINHWTELRDWYE